MLLNHYVPSCGEMSDKSKRCVVVGGCGFLGRHMVEQLLERGYHVNVFDIRTTFEEERVHFFTGDVCKREDLLPVLEGVGVVFHCASPPPSSNDRKLFHRVNVEGTRTLIQSCLEAGVERLVLTSSASVVYEGEDLRNGSEDLPFAARPMDSYTETKILQEKLVLEANGSTSSSGGGAPLMTVAIRPHGIFGPRDPQAVPTMVQACRSGKMKFIIGNGENLVDFTYVVNVVHGHVEAAESLISQNSVSCGQAYNITNDAPLPFWSFVSQVLEGLDYQPPKRKLPYWLVYFIAMVIQFFCVLLRPLVTIRPTFTPMRVALAATHHYYSCEKAKKDFGYLPPVPFEEGVRLTLKHFSHLRNTQ